MIDPNKIQYNQPIYYVPAYGCSLKVSVLRLTNDGNAVVVLNTKRSTGKPFNIPVKFVCYTQKAANRYCKQWESWKRKR